MELSTGQVLKLKSRIFSVVGDEIDLAIRTDTVDQLLDKYGVSLNEEVPPQEINKRMTILVVGDLRGKQNDFVKAAKDLGISKDNLEFVGFDAIKNYDIGKLKYSFKYSDIICGPIPHKINKLHGSNSLISLLESVKDKEAYPKLIKATSEQKDAELKLTISSFKKALLETKLLKEIKR